MAPTDNNIPANLTQERQPLVTITYDVEVGGAIQKEELPFIVGIVADLSGDVVNPDARVPYRQREFVEIDRHSVDEVDESVWCINRPH